LALVATGQKSLLHKGLADLLPVVSTKSM